MTHQSNLYSVSDGRVWHGDDQNISERPILHMVEAATPRRLHTNLTTLSTLFLLLGLLTAVPTGQALGVSAGLIRQSTQQPHNAGSSADGEKDLRVLEPGKPVKRELAGGQQHTYRIRLGADQFSKTVIEQHGIDVVVRLLGPDGKQIFETDSESRVQGQEEVPLAAEVAGEYRLVVRPKQDGAASGNYEIRIEDVRAATDNDRALQEGRKLYEESRNLRRAGRYDEAIPLVERALEIRERLLGQDHRDVAAAVNLLGTLYWNKGEYEKAGLLLHRALTIVEKALGPEHPRVGTALTNLGVLYVDRGEFAKSEAFYQRGLAIREKALGPEHPEVADTLNNLAILYWSKGDYTRAEPLYERALAIREKVLGPEHPDLGDTLDALAILYLNKGDYTRAEPLYERALAIREKALGPEHPDVARGLHNFSIFYYSKGNYAKAESLLQRALTIWEKVLGPEHPDVATAFDNLALIYNDLGDYTKAKPLYERALAIREKTLGPEHPDVARALHNLADFHQNRREYAKAEPLYRRALAIWERTLGPEHPDVAASLDNLALLFAERGDYAKAESLYQRSLTIWEKALGPEHPNLARPLTHLAELYSNRGEYAKAMPLYERALAIREKALGPEHPDVGSTLGDLAMLYAAQGYPTQAIAVRSRANAVSEHNLALNLANGSERQKLAYLAALSRQADRTISMHLRYAPGDPKASSLAATMILQRKGRALDAMSQSLNALRSRFDTQDRALLDRLTDTRSQLARLVLGEPQNMTVEQRRSGIRELEDQAEKIEIDISRRSSEFRAQSLPITLEAVQSAIPSDAALIEFAIYRPFNANAIDNDEAYGKPRYVAYVLRYQGEIQYRELGEAKPIDQAIAALRKAIRNPKREDVKSLARAVDQRVFQPVRPLLGDLTRLLISPDGPLNLVPFAALVDEQGRYLVERYSVSYLASGRDLLRLQVARESKRGSLVIADPDFGEPGRGHPSRLLTQKKGLSKTHPGTESAATAFSNFYFPPLPYTAGEGKALRALLPDATVLTKRQATKAAMLQVRGPTLLHIATHGFFLKDLNLTPTGVRGHQALSDDPKRLLQQLEKNGIRIESPLLRSGLALAGANEQKEDDNGILTALEVTGLNLWGTKLVVLSACDTGLGEVKNGDGVYGLRRALVLAGAETQVISLWAVSDKATQELMISYYRELKQGQGRGEALRRVQLEMLKTVKRRHPYYWASFIQSGEWANMVGKR